LYTHRTGVNSAHHIRTETHMARTFAYCRVTRRRLPDEECCSNRGTMTLERATAQRDVVNIALVASKFGFDYRRYSSGKQSLSSYFRLSSSLRRG
jgi:hypothetical protein